MTHMLLRINLSSQMISTEPIREDWLLKYLGQRGLGTKYLYEEIDATTPPLSEANKLIFATGLLTGSPIPSGSRYSVITKGPLTNAIACSNAGGYWGVELKKAGWDLLIIEGKSSIPVYIIIDNNNVSIESAREVWGMSVWDTDKHIKKQLRNKRYKIAAIGKGGEHQILYSSIVNDLTRSAGRSGVGAVMGSKNLKAIAVKGDNTQTYAEPDNFQLAAKKSAELLLKNPVTGNTLKKYGTQGLMNLINEIGALPTQNHQNEGFEKAYKISGEGMLDKDTEGNTNLVGQQACFNCPIACGRVSKINPHYQVPSRYTEKSRGLEFESAWALGAALGIDDLNAITLANFKCNEQGIDTISFGSTLAAAIEMYEKDILPLTETGFPLTYGSPEVLLNALEATISYQGIGKLLAMGSKKMCEAYGVPELSMSIKGQEFSAYDPRRLKQTGLAYMTNNRGACHMRAYTTLHNEIAEGPANSQPTDIKESVKKLIKSQHYSAVIDALGLCMFASFAWDWQQISRFLKLGFNMNFSVEELECIGERIWNLERQFNLASGLSKKDDSLPKRLQKDYRKLSEKPENKIEIDQMLLEYYEQRGWSTDGIPESSITKILDL